MRVRYWDDMSNTSWWQGLQVQVVIERHGTRLHQFSDPSAQSLAEPRYGQGFATRQDRSCRLFQRQNPACSIAIRLDTIGVGVLELQDLSDIREYFGNLAVGHLSLFHWLCFPTC